MRVLHVTDLFFPSIGGLERHVRSLATERVRRGDVVAVVTLTTTGVSSISTDDGGFPVYRITSGFAKVGAAYASAAKPHHPPVPDPIVARQLAGIIKEFQPDVVWAHNWMIYSYLIFKTHRHPPVVWSQHDYGLECIKRTLVYGDSQEDCPGASLTRCVRCASSQYGTAKGAAIKLGQISSAATLHGRVDMITAISTTVAQSAQRGVGRAVPIRIFPSFVPNTLLQTANRTARPDFLPDSDGYLLYVGSLGPHKGTSDLIDAYARLKTPPPLVVLGSSHVDQPRHWPEGVIVRENIPHDQVMAAWSRCSVGIVPSRWAEPFGQVAVEAACVGKPVVATHTGGLTDIVVDGETGLLVSPGRPSELASAIQRLLDDPDLARRLGARAQKRSTQFTVEVVAASLNDVLLEVADAHAARQMDHA
jgi:glycosyltransferase involved in cell wall biosynthesis